MTERKKEKIPFYLTETFSRAIDTDDYSSAYHTHIRRVRWVYLYL